MPNPIQYYKRTPEGSWIAVPRTTERAIQQFLAAGTWYAVRHEDGSVETNPRASK